MKGSARMTRIHSYREGFPIFKALGSDARIRILEMLIEKGPQFMGAIAEELMMTGGALTAHIKMLHDAGLIAIEKRTGRHGIMKICSINNEGLVMEPPLGES